MPKTHNTVDDLAPSTHATINERLRRLQTLLETKAIPTSISFNATQIDYAVKTIAVDDISSLAFITQMENVLERGFDTDIADVVSVINPLNETASIDKKIDKLTENFTKADIEATKDLRRKRRTYVQQHSFKMAALPAMASWLYMASLSVKHISDPEATAASVMFITPIIALVIGGGLAFTKNKIRGAIFDRKNKTALEAITQEVQDKYTRQIDEQKTSRKDQTRDNLVAPYKRLMSVKI